MSRASKIVAAPPSIGWDAYGQPTSPSADCTTIQMFLEDMDDGFNEEDSWLAIAARLCLAMGISPHKEREQ